MTAETDSWHFENPTNLVFGTGSLSRLSELTQWRSVLLVTSPGAAKRGTLGRIRDLLSNSRVTIFDSVDPEPQLSNLEAAAKSLRGNEYDGIVAFGGGSAIDTAKILSYVLPVEEGQLQRHILLDEPFPATHTLPVAAVPTTAGTGAEVTPFATVWDATKQKKYSFSQPDLYPRFALLDPELTLSAPRDLTLSTGLDALCQGLESLWSRNTNPVAKALALHSVSISLSALEDLVEDLGRLELRSKMMEASLFAGLAIASTRTTLSHSISYPLTLRLGIPHGLACAFTISQVTRFNAETAHGKMQEIAQALGFTDADTLAEKLENLLAQTGALSWLAAKLPGEHEVRALAPDGMTPNRSDNNPRLATLQEIEGILSEAWGTAMEGGKRSG